MVDDPDAVRRQRSEAATRHRRIGAEAQSRQTLGTAERPTRAPARQFLNMVVHADLDHTLDHVVNAQAMLFNDPDPVGDHPTVRLMSETFARRGPRQLACSSQAPHGLP